MRNAGFATRRQSIQQVFRQRREELSRRGTVGTINLDSRPGPASITPSRIKQPKRFSYTGRINTFNPVTGERGFKLIVFSDDELLTRRQIEFRSREVFNRVQANQFLSELYDSVDQEESLDLFDVREFIL